MSYIEAETMSFNQIFDRDEDEYLDGDELLYWVRIFFETSWKSGKSWLSSWNIIAMVINDI